MTQKVRKGLKNFNLNIGNFKNFNFNKWIKTDSAYFNENCVSSSLIIFFYIFQLNLHDGRATFGTRHPIRVPSSIMDVQHDHEETGDTRVLRRCNFRDVKHLRTHF